MSWCLNATTPKCSHVGSHTCLQEVLTPFFPMAPTTSHYVIQIPCKKTQNSEYRYSLWHWLICEPIQISSYQTVRKTSSMDPAVVSQLVTTWHWLNFVSTTKLPNQIQTLSSVSSSSDVNTGAIGNTESTYVFDISCLRRTHSGIANGLDVTVVKVRWATPFPSILQWQNAIKICRLCWSLLMTNSLQMDVSFSNPIQGSCFVSKNGF